MAVDERRYPHYGGRKIPAECSVCLKFKRCHVLDGPEGDEPEYVCPACVTVAIQVTVDQAKTGRRSTDPIEVPPENRSFAYDDEQCPARGVGLHHALNGTPYCIHCGISTYRRGKGPRDRN